MSDYPFDPLALDPPGSAPLPEPADFAAAMALRQAQYNIVASQEHTFLGATTSQYPLDDYQPVVTDLELTAAAQQLNVPAMKLVAADLATAVQTVLVALPPSSALKVNQPDAYWFIGELHPDPANTPTPVNHATIGFMRQFFELLDGYGYTFVNSVAYEVLDFFMPKHWKQLNHNGNPALSGWYPPSCFVRPTSHEAISYLSNVQIQVINEAIAVGLPVKFQIGEPWWWDGSYSTAPEDKFAPCIYDPYTIEQYTAETGMVVPTPYIVSIFDEVAEDQWPYINWLRDKLGESTNAIRDNVKNHFPERQLDATLLFFTPQIMSPASELTRIMNFPIEHWRTPNYDFVQIEDYDWIIEGRLDLVPLTFDAAFNVLGYPRSITHYFVGFILNAWDYHIWPWIDKAIRMAKEADMPYIYVWSYTQVMRDSILYDDLPPAPTSVPIFDLPPNWSAGYRVARDYKTEIITSAGGKEQRRALRRTPRKTVESTVLMSGSDMRRFDSFLASWQGFRFYMPEVTRSVATASALAPDDTRIQLASIPPWLQLGTVVLLVGEGGMEARIVDRIDGVTVDFLAPGAGANSWPVGTRVHPALYGQLGDEVSTRRLNDRVMEASIVFNVVPGSQPALWVPTVAPRTFDGVELFDTKPNWTGPVSATISKQVDTIDYGQGRIQTFLPAPFTQRLTKLRYTNTSVVEADLIDGFFTRMLGQQGVFWAPTWLADMEVDSATVPGDVLYVEGDDITEYLANDSVYRNLCLIDDAGAVTPYKIMATSVASGNRTAITVSPPLTEQVLAHVDKVSWLVLSRLASDGMTEAWTTDTLANIDLNIRSLQAGER